MFAIPLLVAALAVAQDSPCVPDLSPEACQTLLELGGYVPSDDAPSSSAMPTEVAPLAPEGPSPMDQLETSMEETRDQGSQFFDQPGTLVIPDDGNFTEDSYEIVIPEVSPPAPVEEPAP